MKNKISYLFVMLMPIILTGCNLGAAWNIGW